MDLYEFEPSLLGLQSEFQDSQSNTEKPVLKNQEQTNIQPGVGLHAFCPRTWEVEDLFELKANLVYRETLSQNKTNQLTPKQNKCSL